MSAETPPLPEQQSDGMEIGTATYPIPGTRPPSRIDVAWLGARRFDSGRPGGPLARVDGDGKEAQSPPDMLLSALASCAAVDVVDILAKRRTPVDRLTVEVTGHRREDPPRRFERVELHFFVDGAGIEAEQAERALQLAFDKYCTVAASLGGDIVAETRLTLNGETRPPVRQRIWTP